MFLADDEKKILDRGRRDIAQRRMKFLKDYEGDAGAEKLWTLTGRWTSTTASVIT
jgi:hypothetical protein